MKVKQGKTQRWVSIRGKGDLGEIQGRSIDLRVFGVQECQRTRGNRNEDKGEGEGEQGSSMGV